MSEIAARATSVEVLPSSGSSGSLLPAKVAGAGTAFDRVMTQGKQLIGQPAVRRSLPMIVGSLVVGIAMLFYLLTHEPAYQPLFSGLPDADKAAVVEALQAGNFDVKIDEATGSIGVPASDYHKARMMLAAQGLPKSAPSGYDLLDNMPMGASRALEQARLKQSQESQLAASIESIDSVEEARVHLAVPEQSVFIRDQVKPTASVFVKLARGRVLGQSQVQSIVHLVASSVPGLASDQISVIDQNGNLLTSDLDGGALAETQRQMAYQAKLEQQYRERLSALLTPILGQGNFTAEVHADLDFTVNEQTREVFDKDNAVVRSEQVNSTGETLVPARGIPGALSNEAPPAAQLTAAPPANPAAAAADAAGAANVQGAEGAPAAAGAAPAMVGAAVPAAVAPAQEIRNGSYTRNYEIGKEVSVRKVPVGQVRRLSVAVVLRDPPGANPGETKPRTPQELQTIDRLVRGAVGADAQRGDVVTVSSRPFADGEPETPLNWWEQPWIADQAQNLTTLLAVAILVFGGLRPLIGKVRGKKAAADEDGIGDVAALVAPADAAPVEAPAPAVLAEDDSMLRMHQMVSSAEIELAAATSSYEEKVAFVRRFVSGDTARASNVMRTMMRGDLG